MSDIHVLDKRDGQHRLIFHFPVAAGENNVPAAAGGPVTWREAIVASQGGSPVSILPKGDGTKGTISAAELAQIVAGKVLERTHSFVVDSGGVTDAERAKTVREVYAREKTRATDELAAELAYYGAILNEE